MCCCCCCFGQSECKPQYLGDMEKKLCGITGRPTASAEYGLPNTELGQLWRISTETVQTGPRSTAESSDEEAGKERSEAVIEETHRHTEMSTGSLYYALQCSLPRGLRALSGWIQCSAQIGPGHCLKRHGGGLCVYFNKDWSRTADVKDSCCTPDLL